MRLDLIEHHCLTRLRMNRDARGNLSRAQIVCAVPLKLQAYPSTVGFDFRSVVCTKELLPRDVKPRHVVSNVHQALPRKHISNRRVERLIHLATIDDWGFTAVGRSLDTMEPDFQRPAVHLRTLVVRKDGL